MKYKYDDLIDAYFKRIKLSLSKFTVNGCREFVKQNKKSFNEEKFMRILALRLVEVDDEWTDEYDLDSDYEKIDH